MHFIKYLSAGKFIALLRNAACFVGNSSAGLKEGGYLGVPVVNIGTRQNGRVRGANVIDADYDDREIRDAVRRQLDHGPYEPDHHFFKPDCAATIAGVLAGADLYVQKRFYEESAGTDAPAASPSFDA